MLGRNDPCHCGSGKKYKKCHLDLDQGSARTLRSLSTPTQHVNYHWSQLEPRASELAGTELGMVEQRWPAPLHSDLFRPLMTHHALLDVGQHNDTLSSLIVAADQKAADRADSIADALCASHLSCFEVKQCRRESYVELKDNFTGATFQIYDTELSNEIEPLEVIVGRAVFYDGQWSLLAGWSKLTFRKRKRIVEQVRTHYESLGADLQDQDEMKAHLKRSPETILGAVLEHNGQAGTSL